jgi:hypothetical protein
MRQRSESGLKISGNHRKFNQIGPKSLAQPGCADRMAGLC